MVRDARWNGSSAEPRKLDPANGLFCGWFDWNRCTSWQELIAKKRRISRHWLNQSGRRTGAVA